MAAGDDARESDDDAVFRAEVREWLADIAPRHERPAGQGPAPTTVSDYDRSHREAVDAARRWQRAVFDGGFAAISWPTEFGGQGGTATRERIFDEERSKYRVGPGPLMMALSMVAPTLMQHGSPEQQHRHLAAILRGEEVWAQLYSEPDAGSDLAALRTRAERDGDEWVVNGQKVWTSGAAHADWAILLARTDPSRPKHHGITYFIVDMKTPGLTVRPLRQMSGSYHFNEVFLNDVRLPADAVVGEVDQGWRVAHATMANERSMIGTAMASNVEDLIALVRAMGRSDDVVVRQALVQIIISDRLLQFHRLRAKAQQKRGDPVGPGMAVTKLMFSKMANAAASLAVDVQGPAGVVKEPAFSLGGKWFDAFLNGPGLRIGGGTDEVQRNGIAERILGLPREPTSDRDAPFSSSL